MRTTFNQGTLNSLESNQPTHTHHFTGRYPNNTSMDFTTAEQELANDRLLAQFKYIALRDLGHPEYGVPHLARQLGLSQRTLFRRFRTIFGDTPAAYLREVRMEHAKALLMAGKRSTIESVATTVGYEDAAYFSRQFLKHFGIRPQQVMRNKQAATTLAEEKQLVAA